MHFDRARDIALRWGRHEDNPRTHRAQVFPYRPPRPARDRSRFRGEVSAGRLRFHPLPSSVPRNLEKLSSVLDDLGTESQMIQPLYISVDPDRDTPPAMKTFHTENYPHFLGLTGDREKSESARVSFNVFSGHGQDPDEPEGYVVPHTALTHLLSPDAHCLTHFSEIVTQEQMVERLRQLLRSHGDPELPQ